jgi:hypothetical protein
MQQPWKKNLFDPLCFLTPAPTFFKKPISTSFSTIRLKFSLIYVFKRCMMAVKGVREKPALLQHSSRRGFIRGNQSWDVPLLMGVE